MPRAADTCTHVTEKCIEGEQSTGATQAHAQRDTADNSGENPWNSNVGKSANVSDHLSHWNAGRARRTTGEQP